MKKRIIAYGSVLAVLLTGCAIYLYVSTFFSGVSIGNYLSIHAGDEAKDVHKRLGGPKNGPDWQSGTPALFENQGWIEDWHGSVINITIIYDRDSHVIEASQSFAMQRGSWFRENMSWLIKFQEVRE